MTIKLKDQLGRTVFIPKKPLRIVSLVPSQTELLISLGLEEQLVGITKFCVHPTNLKQSKTKVGGTKKVNYKKLAALEPNIILCNKEENTKEIVTTLEQDYPVHVSDIANLSDTYALITAYGKLFSCEEKAAEINHKINTAQSLFKEYIRDKTKKKVLYLIWKKPWMAAGKGTFIDHLMMLNGFMNVMKTEERYPQITTSELQKMDVDLILLSSEPFPFSKKHRAEIQQIISKATIELVDGEFFSWYGSRLIKAFPYFKSLHT